MSLTNNQVKFKFSSTGSKFSNTTDNGDIIFDSANHKIYARGQEWIGTDTWKANALNVAGYVAAPTSSTANKVWKTDANGNPAWRDDANTQYSAGSGLSLSGTTFSASLVSTTKLGGAVSVATDNANRRYPVSLDSAGKLAVVVPWFDSHYITRIYAGASGTVANSITSNGETYIKITDNNVYRNQIKIFGSGATNVSSDANGNIKIESTDSHAANELKIYADTDEITSFDQITDAEIKFIQGDNVTLTGNSTSHTITISSDNTWNANALNVAGYVAAPTSSTANKVWKTDANGNPAWRDDANDNTQNTAGTINKASTKLFLVGAESQAAHPVTNSNINVYIGTDNCLYSNGSKVLTSHQDISGKAEKNATVSTVTYDTTNKKLTKTINGTTSDIVTAAKIVADGDGLTSQYTTHIYTNGSTASSSNVSSATSNPYIQLYDSTTAREKIQFVGSGSTSISANGNAITISSTNYSSATTTALGLLKVSNKLTYSQGLTSASGTTSGRYYGVQMDKDGVAFVNVPWTNVNSNYLTTETQLSKGINSTASTSLSFGGTYTSITNFSVSGHTITPTVTTFTLPSNPNTDSNVLQTSVTAASYTNWRPICWGSSSSATEGFSPSTVTGQVYTATTLTCQPSSGTIRANKFRRIGSSDSYVLLGAGGHKALSDFFSYTKQSYTLTSSSNLYPILVADTSGNTSYTASEFYINSSGVYFTSDKNKKTDIHQISNEDVDRIFETENAGLNYYKWKDENKGDKQQFGYIAQEIQEIAPESVDFNKDTSLYNVNYDVANAKVLAAVFKKVKEQDKEIKELKEMVNLLLEKLKN